jgi:hypothetical protein
MKMKKKMYFLVNFNSFLERKVRNTVVQTANIFDYRVPVLWRIKICLLKFCCGSVSGLDPDFFGRIQLQISGSLPLLIIFVGGNVKTKQSELVFL